MVGNNAWRSEIKKWIEIEYPNLNYSQYNITSSDTIDYNCVAWAAEDVERWWWPDAMYESYWPVDVSREETLAVFIKVFEFLGYKVCDNGLVENNCQKVAIYCLKDKPTHVARQLINGKWTSKLGQYEDIEHHTIEGLEGNKYGKVTVFMKKRLL